LRNKIKIAAEAREIKHIAACHLPLVTVLRIFAPMNLLRLLAGRFTFVWFGVLIRNKLFDMGFIPSTEIKDVSLIGVGNLTVVEQERLRM